MLDTKYVTKIVVTGGPCAGRTTALATLEKAFSRLGYYVLFTGRTDADMRSNSATPEKLGSKKNFERMRLQLQRAKEGIYESDAHYLPHRKILLICDGGTMDGRALMENAEFEDILASEGWSETELRDTYDGVFHLVTAAKGARGYYHGEYTPEEAAAIDDGLIAAWTGHPHLRIIGNEKGFEAKVDRLVHEVRSFLGVPEPMESTRRFLLARPDTAWLEATPSCQPVEITLTYLREADGEELLLVRRGSGDDCTYFEVSRRDLVGSRRTEVERRLTKEAYEELLAGAEDPLTITKTRYCLSYKNQSLGIDVYPFWDDQAIAVVDVIDDLQKVEFPPEIRVIREVSEDPDFRDSHLARSAEAGRPQAGASFKKSAR